MIFSDPTTKQGIVQDAYFEAGADANSYPIEDVTRNANTGLDTVVSLILGADGKWQFDDSNATDLPIGETDLISGQQDYSFDEEYLVIKSIECSDSQGNWSRLIPIDNNDVLRTQAMSNLSLTDGVPRYYDKMGESILLYPAPSYNRRLVQEGEAGLRAYFQRKINYFETTDTTKEPGFAKIFHKYISLCVQYGYACAKNLDNLAQNVYKKMQYYQGNKLEGGTDEGAIKRFYSYREVDQRHKLTMNTRVKR